MEKKYSKVYSYMQLKPNGRYYRNTFRQWRKKPPGTPKKNYYSRHFGYLNLYTEKELGNLLCPSGYSISQGFARLRKLWMGYRVYTNKNKIDKMKQYASLIQETERDMGIETASFPFLGLLGERLVLYDKKANTGSDRKIIRDEDHRPLLKTQKMYLLKQEVAEDEEIQTLMDDKLHIPQQEATVPMLLEPAQDEQLVVMPDEIPFMKCSKCDNCGQYMSFDMVHQCPPPDTQVLSDNVPFVPRQAD